MKKCLHVVIGMLVAGSVCVSAQAAVPAGERAVLHAIYQQAGGFNWLHRQGWEGEAGTECAWDGVACSPAGDHVTGLSLRNNGLSGTLPALSGLPGLTNFDAGNEVGCYKSCAPLNQLTGSIPSLAGLEGLRVFSVRGNQLSGGIPALSEFPQLEVFDVSGNQLSGSIPALAGLSNLRFFDVSYNQLGGGIPALSGLANLQTLAVSSNQLSGSLPSLAGLPNLSRVLLSYNQFTGPIPSLAGLSNLSDFAAERNRLTGSIPALTGLSHLEFFDVMSNQLSGSIPDLTSLSLTSFLVGTNRLTGDVPAAPATLYLGLSSLCNNPLNHASSSAWDAATGVSPWYSMCSVQPCVESATTACLQSNRFAVSVTWKYYDGTAGAAKVMYFSGLRAGNDESSLWTFQTPTNHELSVKVLSRCAHGWGNTFQVLIGALTDQGWTATVLDTLNNSTYVFSNATPGVIPPVMNNDHIESCP